MAEYVIKSILKTQGKFMKIHDLTGPKILLLFFSLTFIPYTILQFFDGGIDILHIISSNFTNLIIGSVAIPVLDIIANTIIYTFLNTYGLVILPFIAYLICYHNELKRTDKSQHSCKYIVKKIKKTGIPMFIAAFSLFLSLLIYLIHMLNLMFFSGDEFFTYSESFLLIRDRFFTIVAFELFILIFLVIKMSTLENQYKPYIKKFEEELENENKGATHND